METLRLSSRKDVLKSGANAPAFASKRASTTTMRSMVLTAPRCMKIESFSKPEPGKGEVRVRLEGCGVCGSNLSPWEGRPWFQYPFEPGAPGHEGWGRIDSIGPGVSRVHKGDRVALLSQHAFAEFDVASESAVVRLPHELDGLPFPGEAIGCAFNVFERCEIQPGQTVSIVGIGFLGALLTALCAGAGATVIAISRRPFALDTALRLGAKHALPMNDHSALVEGVRALTSGAGCDRVIEAVGLQWPLDLATDLTRERGRLIIAGYHQDGPRQVNMQLWNWRGLDVINAHERDPARYVAGMEAAVKAAASGSVDPKERDSFEGKPQQFENHELNGTGCGWNRGHSRAPKSFSRVLETLLTHRFSLEEISDAFTAMRERPDTFLKAIVTL